jgi:6-phosphofructokinase 1
VIGAAAIEAIASGLNVIGIFDGYRHLASGEVAQVRALTLDSVAHIHLTGGSILRTSRTNPARDDATLERCIASLDRLGVRYLMCIGGDDTTYGATRIAARTRGRIGVVSVPKTIDNDLPLPENAPTFGFETARAVGAGIVENLLEDARTTARWYVCVSMGRTSGALALGMCLGAGANLAVIPEELPAAGRLARVTDILAGAVVKARARGRGHGVAVVGEGVAEGVPAEELARDASLPTDTYGHVRLADIPIGAILRDGLRARLTALGVDADIVSKDIGYELRCAKPLPFDVEYTRKLGFGAVRALVRGESGVLIGLAGGRATALELGALLDPATGRLRIRRVDVAGESYATARASMERLEPPDLAEPQLAHLAAQTTWTPRAFASSFAGAAGA